MNKQRQFCWCGSKKKSEECCLRASKIPKFTHPRVQSEIEECCFKGCTSKGIASHSISRVHIEQISANRHVFIYANPSGIFIEGLPNPTNYHLDFIPIGLNEASTFKGFCPKHDVEIFKGIDSAVFSITAENIFLIGFRAVSYRERKTQ